MPYSSLSQKVDLKASITDFWNKLLQRITIWKNATSFILNAWFLLSFKLCYVNI